MTLYGYEGNDTFNVNSTNGIDIIDGGSGYDSISYNFNLQDYSYTYSNNQLTINHPGGKKTLKNFETFQFNDIGISNLGLQLGEIIQDIDTSNQGNREIYKTQKGAYILDDTGVLGQFPQAPSIFIILKEVVIINLVRSQFHTMRKMVGTVVTYTFTEVAEKHGIKIYFIQKDDIHLKYSKTEKISLTDLLAQESAKGKDFTGEGVIGDKISKVFTNGSGQKGFYKLSSESYIIDNNGLNVGSSPQNQVIPQKNGKPFTFKYTPKGATSYYLSESSGEVNPVIDVYAESNARSKLWSYDTFNANSGEWMYTSSKPLLYSEILAKENSFQTDLDGDGNYGDRIYQLKASHDSTGKSLYKTDSGALVVDSKW